MAAAAGVTLNDVPAAYDALSLSLQGQMAVVTPRKIVLISPKIGSSIEFRQTSMRLFELGAASVGPNRDEGAAQGTHGDARTPGSARKGNHISDAADEGDEDGSEDGGEGSARQPATKSHAILAAGETLEPGEDSNMAISRILFEEFRSCAWSPIGVSRTFGCLLLTLTTQCRVSICEPAADPATGAWQEAYAITTPVVKHFKSTSPLSASLDVQTTAIAWSPATMTSSGKSRSLIALGSKSGKLSLWMFFDIKQIDTVLTLDLATRDSLQRIHCIDFAQQWIGNSSEPEIQEIHIAAGIGDGSVSLFTIRLTTSQDGQTTVTASEPRSLLPPGTGLLTTIRFSPPDQGLIVIGRSKQLHVCSVDPNQDNAMLYLPSWMTVTGIVWVLGERGMRVYCTDGVCVHISVSSITATPRESQNMRLKLSIQSDLSQAFMAEVHCRFELESQSDLQRTKQESDGNGDQDGSDEEMDDDDAGIANEEDEYISKLPRRLQIFGATSSYNSICDFVIYRLGYQYKCIGRDSPWTSPNMIIWYPKARIKSEHDETALFADAVKPHIFRICSPSIITWDILQMIADSVKENRRHGSKSGALFASALMDFARSLESAFILHEPSTEKSTTAIFDDVGMNCLRLFVHLFATTKDIWSQSPIAREIHASISDKMRLLHEHYLACLAATLKKSFYAQSVQPDVFDDDDAEKAALALLARQAAISNNTNLQLAFSNVLMASRDDTEIAAIPDLGSPSEPCPACNAPLSINNFDSSVCANGHRWDRCSVSFKIIDSLEALTCLGCESKRCQFNDHVGRLWDIRGIQQCVYCGDRFREPNLSFLSAEFMMD